MDKRVGIIGAGIAGLAIGNKLAEKGFQVEILGFAMQQFLGFLPVSFQCQSDRLFCE
jgi:2-polyprenyl-6-methoxyphenol hydroxylase-like FAD-dependent oxidoreductase